MLASLVALECDSGHAGSSGTRSELYDLGIEIAVPKGWQPPAAQLGAHVPRFQDGERTVSPTVYGVYLSPTHADDWGEIEFVLYEIDARSWLNAMVIQPEKWLPVRGDKLLPYSTSDQDNVVGSLLPFGNVSAVKFRISRTLRGLGGQEIRFQENLHYCSCGDMLLRVQMRSAPEHFSRLEASVFTSFEEQFRCSRPR